jgi:two-component system, NtrC family, sensor kinase
MKRPARGIRKPVKTRRRKAVTPKRRDVPKAAGRRASSPVREKTEIARLRRELAEAREQQSASAEVLGTISRSTGKLEPVFEAMLRDAVRLCRAKFGFMLVPEGDKFRLAAEHGIPTRLLELLRREPLLEFGPETMTGRAIATRRTISVDDMRKQAGYRRGHPRFVALTDLGGARSAVFTPMLKGAKPIGVLIIFRQDVGRFAARQIELVQNFAAQAVIAIENTRLLNELRESLEQQTATADVLKVISSSPGELEPVFGAMLENATRICEAKFGMLWLSDGDGFRSVAVHGVPPALAAARPSKFIVHFSPDTPFGRLVATKRLVHVPDIRAEPTYLSGFRPLVELSDLGGARTLLVVPMLKEDVLVGTFAIYRQEIRPFADKQIEIMQSFAAQAVIAIENTRLLGELRQRTDDLSQSLAQQTATAEVLGVISRSKFELQPILQSVVDTAARLCRAESAVIFRLDDEVYRFAAGYSLDPAYVEIERQFLIAPGPETVVGRAAISRRVAIIDDAWNDPLYKAKEEAKVGGVRSMIGVPLMREGEPIGVIALARKRVEPFLTREIELVTTFADQAVIAIENVRLFEAEQQRTRELAKSLEDLRTAQDRLVQSQKLASLGQLTAGIAHEIKNPLNFVNNFSSLSVELIGELQETLETVYANDKASAEIAEITDTLRSNLAKVVQHGKRADSIVKNMLLHSREGSGEHRLVDVNALVEESLNLAYHGARAEKQDFTITLKRAFDPAAGEADLYPQEITRVLLNLISNGFYAATQRKKNAGKSSFEPALAAATKNLGDSVEICIRDNGNGIAPEVKEKMFNPFFTTKPAGEGTGLGLSISYDIVVKQHAGMIEVDTLPGEFTEIRIVLPRAAASGAKAVG